MSELENSLRRTDLTERSVTRGEVETRSLGEGDGEFLGEWGTGMGERVRGEGGCSSVGETEKGLEETSLEASE